MTTPDQERQAQVLRESPSRGTAAERLGITPAAAKVLACRLRALGLDVPLLGRGGRPRSRIGWDEAWGGQWTAVPAGDFRVVSEAEMRANLVAGNLYELFGDGSPLTVLP